MPGASWRFFGANWWLALFSVVVFYGFLVPRVRYLSASQWTCDEKDEVFAFYEEFVTEAAAKESLGFGFSYPEL